MFLKNKKVITGLLSVIFIVTAAIAGCLYYKKDKNIQNPNIIKEKPETSSKIDYSTLDKIIDYQNRYFDIIKRHDALLSVNNDEEIKKDFKELKELYREVESKADKNSEFFKRYKDIEEKYKDNDGETTLEMNTFALKHYEEVDKLLNDTYKAVKSSISDEEFYKLKLNQREWLKETENYNTIFEKQGFGTIGTLIKSGYETDMRNFRILLLMLYLKDKNNNNAPKIDDFIGSWAEVNAGRIYVEIKKNNNNKITVEHGGANSAYSHSVSKYECDFDNVSGSLICLGAEHTDQFMSCNGFSSDDNFEEFLKCDEENPSLTKDDYKTYTDNEKRVKKKKKGTYNHFLIDDDEYMPEDRKNEIKKDYKNMRLYFEGDKDIVFYKYKK